MFKIINISSGLGSPDPNNDMKNGPDVITNLILTEYSKSLDNNIDKINIPKYNPGHFRGIYEKSKNLPEILFILDELKKKTNFAVSKNHIPLILMGDDSYTPGALYGLSENLDEIGVIWIDAHGDINTPETTISGCLYGMGLAHIIGIGHPDVLKINSKREFVKPKNVIMIGQRSLDPLEVEIIKEKRITLYPPKEIRNNKERTIHGLIEQLKNNGINKIFVHYDLDVLDIKHYISSFGPVNNGLSPMELYELTGYLQQYFQIIGCSFTNYLPEKDKDKSGLAIIDGLVNVLFRSTNLK